METKSFRLFIVDLLSGMSISKSLNEIKEMEGMSYEEVQELSLNNYMNLRGVINSNQELNDFYTSLPDKKSYSKMDYRYLESLSYVKSSNSIKKSTSGSTGQPFSYYTSVKSQSYLWAGILYSWKTAGYNLGEKVAIIAGSALNDKGSYKKKIFNLLMNFQVYDIGSGVEGFECEVILDIDRKNIKFIYGYASVIYQLARYLKENDKFLKVKSVVSTAENLSGEMRALIEERFLCKVFNQYGCNDAGLSAFECQKHNGFHYLANRAYVQQVDNMLVSTDCFNTSMPMLNYETGDFGIISDSECDCGLPFPVISEVNGRQNDFIELDGKRFHSVYFTSFFKNVEGIDRYQVLQDPNGEVMINLETSLLDKNGIKKVLDRLESLLGIDILFDPECVCFYSRDNGKIPVISQVEYLIK